MSQKILGKTLIEYAERIKRRKNPKMANVVVNGKKFLIVHCPTLAKAVKLAVTE